MILYNWCLQKDKRIERVFVGDDGKEGGQSVGDILNHSFLMTDHIQPK